MKKETKGTAEIAVQDPRAIVEGKIKGLREMLEHSPVTNEVELGGVSDKLKAVKNLLAYIKQEKDKLVAPAKAIIAEAGEKYDPFIKECQNAEGILKGRAQKYLDDKDAAAKKAEATIAKKVEAGTMKTETAIKKLEAMPEQKATVRTADSGIRRSVRNVPVIVEPDKVPDEFWIIDEVRVRREALERLKAGLPQIPGVEIRQESSISSV